MTLRRWLRRGAWAMVVGIALAIFALVILWTQRRPLATNAIDRELARRGVQSSYRIGSLGLRRQRLEDIRIGDPAHPDLTAKSAEIALAVGFDGIGVRSIVAEGVRLRGRLIEGKVTFGQVDKLLPAPSGAPFTLPDVRVDLRDARMRLETAMGAIGLALDGRGNLADGFGGRLAAVAPKLTVSGCTLDSATAFVNIAIARRKPALDGPLRAVAASCGGVRLDRPQVAIDVDLPEALDAWKGTARIDVAGAAQRGWASERIAGNLSFDGSARETRGTVALEAAALKTPLATGGAAMVEGRYRIAAGGVVQASGKLGLRAAALTQAMRSPIARVLAAAAGTPIAPIATQLGTAIARAGEDADADATFAFEQRGGVGAARITTLDARSGSGVRATLADGTGVTYGWPAGVARIDGTLAIGGGGLPDTTLTLAQAAGSNAVSGEARIASMQAGGSTLALAPLRFGPGPGGTRFASAVTLTGPLGGGRVTQLATPIAGRFDAQGGFRIGERCQPLAFARLEIAGMRFGATRLPLCPLTGGAMLARKAGGRIMGGARIAPPRLIGRVGQTPLSIAARTLSVPIAKPGFVADAVAIQLGAGEDPTKLNVRKLTGDVDARGIAGRFEDAAGRLANVPLLVSDATGPWRLENGRITLQAELSVTDAAAAGAARFRPTVAHDFRLAFANDLIHATGTLREPRSDIAVSAIDIVHRLSTGAGRAVLDVTGIPFGKLLQPDQLTPLALGVVANVVGSVKGRGEIRWDVRGVTSDGAFRTDALDLAAAFGPVTGLKGEIRFTDLLGLETAPHQIVTLAEVNPGIAVTDGQVCYQLLAGQRIGIEEGRWPFSGGLLVLEPTVLNMGVAHERRLTFRVEALDAAKFIQRFEVDNVAATGLFDGSLPMIFDEDGGRIVGGRIVARPEGGTLAYVGDISNAALGTFSKMAFDALKRMRYKNLAIEFDGAIDGEIVSKVIFTGNNELPVGGKAPGGLMAKFVGLPFKFNIVIKAPFRGLMGAMKSFTDPGDLIRSQLPNVPASAVVQPTKASPAEAVQPKVSEDKR